jgi:hypothetical protein
MLNQKQTHKLPGEQFRNILAANNYNFAVTAKAIQKKYKINYSRQAVRQRAKTFEGDMSEKLYRMAIRNIGNPYNY